MTNMLRQLSSQVAAWVFGLISFEAERRLRLCVVLAKATWAPSPSLVFLSHFIGRICGSVFPLLAARFSFWLIVNFEWNSIYHWAGHKSAFGPLWLVTDTEHRNSGLAA